jgi:hypothetical protein
MADQIRRITKDDFAKIALLFDNEKSERELRWLFADPESDQKCNGFVAVSNEDRVVGVIGFATSKYHIGKRAIRGVVPMSWRIAPGYKGFAGISLMKQAISQGEFSFVIGGTQEAQNLYPLFGFIPVQHRYKLFNIFNPMEFFNSLDAPFVSRFAKTLILMPACIKSISEKSIYQDIQLTEYTKNDPIPACHENIFEKKLSRNYINWIMNCPLVDSFAFKITKGKTVLGVCLLFVKHVKNIKRGRIVYLPYLGKDKKLWRSVISKILGFLKSQNCCAVSAIATNEDALNGMSTCLFRLAKSQTIFVKSGKDTLNDINLQNWHIQYTEGDKAYLGFS